MQLILDSEEAMPVRFKLMPVDGDMEVWADGDRIGYFRLQGNDKITFVADLPLNRDAFNVNSDGKLTCM